MKFLIQLVVPWSLLIRYAVLFHDKKPNYANYCQIMSVASSIWRIFKMSIFESIWWVIENLCWWELLQWWSWEWWTGDGGLVAVFVRSWQQFVVEVTMASWRWRDFGFGTDKPCHLSFIFNPLIWTKLLFWTVNSECQISSKGQSKQ